jgi:hypothetical protein
MSGPRGASFRQHELNGKTITIDQLFAWRKCSMQLCRPRCKKRWLFVAQLAVPDREKSAKLTAGFNEPIRIQREAWQRRNGRKVCSSEQS